MALNDLIRKAKMVFTTIGLVQKYKISVFETKDAEASERFQDYGFSSQPSEGEGLVIDAGGSMFVLRVDRLKDRPQLANDEVAVWQKDGAKIHLKKSKVIDIDCQVLNVNASESVNFNAPVTNFEGSVAASGVISSAVDVMSGSVSGKGHQHKENNGNKETEPPTT